MSVADGTDPQAPADAQTLADATARAMLARDRAMQSAGLALREVRPGFCRLAMTVREDMVNALQIGHGGYIFLLADSSFALACNSHGQNAVAMSASIDFLKPAKLGDVLVATAVEQAQAGRHGIYDIRVENQHGELIALCRGKSAQVRGSVLPA